MTDPSALLWRIVEQDPDGYPTPACTREISRHLPAVMFDNRSEIYHVFRANLHWDFFLEGPMPHFTHWLQLPSPPQV